MKYLLRASSHGNHVTVIDDTDNKVIAKTSCDPRGISCLQKEQNGLEWYSTHLNVHISNLLEYAYFSDKYSRINIKKFDGKQVLYKSSFLTNYNYLEQCVEHYLRIWPKEAKTPVHGDMTLDNVIFRQGEARLFDWEHFTTEEHPWGFDILYCMLSALLLPLEVDEFPSKQDYTKFLDLLFVLFDNGLSADLAEYPLSQYRKIFSTKTCWTTITDHSPNKLFPLRYSELYVDIVDDQITRRIRHKRYDDFKKAVLIGEK